MNKLFLMAVMLLAGCGPEADMPMHTKDKNAPEVLADQQRVEITRIGIFPDRVAYNGRRGVYVIKDTQTGREFIGVSGVGISETGSHMAGKAMVTDER